MSFLGDMNTKGIEFMKMSCPDCGAAPGKVHSNNCDVARCSACGGQRLQCLCRLHDKQFARWTGFWPGKLEADALGISLNMLHESGIAGILFKKPKLSRRRKNG